MPPEMKQVYSTQVSQIGYDEENLQLWVRFRNGALYVYFEIPPEVGIATRDAPSVGEALDRSVKKAGYAYKRVE